MILATSIKADVWILSFNDTYNSRGNKYIGGIARMATAIQELKAKNPNIITTVNGDILQDPPISNYTKGAHIIEIFNEMGIDYACIGNHEFDFGTPNLIKQIKHSNMLWLSANIIYKGRRSFPKTEEYKIIEKDGLRIGIFGICTTTTKQISSPSKETEFEDEISSAKRMVSILKEKNVDVIVALTHLNLQQDIDLAKQVHGINIILGGHDHFPVNIIRHGTFISKSGSDYNFLSIVKLSKNKYGNVIMYPSWEMVTIDSSIPRNKKVEEIIERYKKQYNLASGTERILLHGAIDCSELKTKETSIANLISDAIYNNLHSLDGVVINAGLIRCTECFMPKSLIDRYQLLQLLPYKNKINLVRLTGADLQKLLELSLNKMFPGVSGIRIQYSIIEGEKRIDYISIKGKKLQPEKKYNIAINNFLFNLLHKNLQNPEVIIPSIFGKKAMEDIVVDYIINKGEISPKIDGRITEKYP